MSQIEQTRQITPRITLEKHLPKEHCFCLDIGIKLYGKELLGRLLFSSTFQREWKKSNSAPLTLSSTRCQQLMLTMSIEAGKTALTIQQWKDIKIGDCVLLDCCLIDPLEAKGRVILAINGTAVFRGKIKPGSLKILELSLYNEEERPMEKNFPSDNPFRKNPFQEDFETDEFDPDTTEDREDVSSNENSQSQTNETAHGKTESPHQEQTSVDIQNLPLSVTIEVGRLKMTVQKL